MMNYCYDFKNSFKKSIRKDACSSHNLKCSARQATSFVLGGTEKQYLTGGRAGERSEQPGF